MSDAIVAPHRGAETPKSGASPTANPASADARVRLLGLAVASIGVVYGDIGTSPLYALREAVNAAVGPNTAAGVAAPPGPTAAFTASRRA